jgi:hypothetical protein
MRGEPGPLLEPGRVSTKKPGRVDPTRLFLSFFFFFSSRRLPFLLLHFSLFSLPLTSLSLTWIGPRPPWPRSLLSRRRRHQRGGGSFFLPLGCSFFSLPLVFSFSHPLGSVPLSLSPSPKIPWPKLSSSPPLKAAAPPLMVVLSLGFSLLNPWPLSLVLWVVEVMGMVGIWPWALVCEFWPWVLVVFRVNPCVG